MLCHKIIKIFHASTMLAVNSVNKGTKITKMQDEQAYSKMIEDFCKLILKKKVIVLMRLIPYLMHAGFISFKTFEAICKSFEQFEDDQHLSESEKEFIKKFCLDIVKSKWADKNKLKREVV